MTYHQITVAERIASSTLRTKFQRDSPVVTVSREVKRTRKPGIMVAAGEGSWPRSVTAGAWRTVKALFMKGIDAERKSFWLSAQPLCQQAFYAPVLR
ncbi:MAG TPA: hypothetical protein DF427_05280 [Moraxellaceae bacterium]|nr:hypothetical protein [Moraxellaceae bacterium]